AATVLGFEGVVRPLIAGPLAAALLLAAAWQLASGIARRNVLYKLGPQRLEIERGLLGKRFESIDLWRVRDVVLEQSLLQRLRGAGTLTVYSSDQVDPVLAIGPVAAAKSLYDQLRDAVAAARKDARVIPVDGR